MTNYDIDELERTKELDHLKKTLRMIQLSSDSIRELEALSMNNNVPLSWLVKTALEDHLSQTPIYNTQGEYYASG
jgi:hypothetical protein|tara:strand:- start:1854 stop:2078 length:225 start_codon:yes stop_codon:yes gene_type:complete